MQNITTLSPAYPLEVAEQIFEAGTASVAIFASELLGPNVGIDRLRVKFL